MILVQNQSILLIYIIVTYDYYDIYIYINIDYFVFGYVILELIRVKFLLFHIRIFSRKKVLIRIISERVPFTTYIKNNFRLCVFYCCFIIRNGISLVSRPEIKPDKKITGITYFSRLVTFTQRNIENGD